ncbi:MAG TPA: NAD(P)H-hydrate dehydratase [bacterium]|nr:NAD(P)H-hydrate dehydratase [bacterium]
MKILTAQQMAYIDKTTIEGGTPGIELMRNAGMEVYKLIDDTLNIRSGIVVLAGKGNNGGDGFRVAELMANQGYDITVCLVGEKTMVQGDAATCMHDLEKTGQKIIEINGHDKLEALSKEITSANLIIDALFGTGLKGEITGLPASVIDKVNSSKSTVVAVDIPSGVNASTGEVSNSTIQADYTVTFGCLKVGHVFMPGRKKCGITNITDIGFSDEIINSIEPFGHSLASTEAAVLLPKRPYNAHKGSTGKVFVLSGSVGMTGAATLASKAAMRVGAGVVTIGCPVSLNDILEAKCTEAMTLPLPEVRKKRCLSLRALGMVRDVTQLVDVVAVGPGLGIYCETKELVRRFISQYKGKIVLDADGINSFKGNIDELKNAPGEIIVTPHYGELSKLMGLTVKEIAGDPIKASGEAAKLTGKIILLKGTPTIISSPQGISWINGTGNQGMATAGMGDVLTGVITGFAAQGVDIFDAAVLGAYVHGLAGDFAAEEQGIPGMVSGDVLELLPQALITISESS